jgi:hypothetical protein
VLYSLHSRFEGVEIPSRRGSAAPKIFFASGNMSHFFLIFCVASIFVSISNLYICSTDKKNDKGNLQTNFRARYYPDQLIKGSLVSLGVSLTING